MFKDKKDRFVTLWGAGLVLWWAIYVVFELNFGDAHLVDTGMVLKLSDVFNMLGIGLCAAVLNLCITLGEVSAIDKKIHNDSVYIEHDTLLSVFYVLRCMCYFISIMYGAILFVVSIHSIIVVISFGGVVSVILKAVFFIVLFILLSLFAYKINLGVEVKDCEVD